MNEFEEIQKVFHCFFQISRRPLETPFGSSKPNLHLKQTRRMEGIILVDLQKPKTKHPMQTTHLKSI